MRTAGRGRGEAILAFLVQDADGAQSIREIARAIGVRDGRAARGPLDKLIEAGLVQSFISGRLHYPTDRGREVDRILDEITPARGGRFVPSMQAGIAFTESNALYR